MDEKDIKCFPFYEVLTEEEKREISKQSRKVSFKKNQLIASTEFDCLGVLYILKGLVRIYLYSEDGREVTIARIGEDDLCLLSASCMLHQVSFPAQVEAETDAEAILIPIKTITDIKEKNVYVENYLYRLTTERFSNVISAVEQMLFMSLEQRIISFLIDESARTGENTINITKERLAQSIGSAREAVSRSLKSLGEKGLISVSRGKVTILDKKAMYGRL